MKIGSYFLIVPIVLILLASCATVRSDKNEMPVEEVVAIETIVILPPEESFENEQKMDPHLNQVEKGQEVFTALMADYFKDMQNVRLISRSEQEGMPIDITDSRIDLIRRVGKLLNCDAVMSSTIHHFIPFDASESRPASVGFEYKLVAVETGQILCSGVFYETQQALSENIFSLPKAFSRKFKWISAEELAREGLYEKLDKCFYLRHDQ